MSKKKDYLFDITPRWLKYSGLPQQLNKKYGDHAWTIFKCLIELDCRYNPDYPDTFDQSFEEIADLTGTTRQTVSKYIKLFERDGLLSVKRGKSIKEKSTFKLANSIKTPKDPKEIRRLQGGLLNRKGRQPLLRYAKPVKGFDVFQRPDSSKTDTQPVKNTQATRKKPLHQREVKRSKEKELENTNQAQAISSSPKEEEIRLLKPAEIHERRLALFRELNQRRKQKEEEEQRKRQPEIEKRRKAFLRQAKRLIKEESKGE